MSLGQNEIRVPISLDTSRFANLASSEIRNILQRFAGRAQRELGGRVPTTLIAQRQRGPIYGPSGEILREGVTETFRFSTEESRKRLQRGSEQLSRLVLTEADLVKDNNKARRIVNRVLNNQAKRIAREETIAVRNFDEWNRTQSQILRTQTGRVAQERQELLIRRANMQRFLFGQLQDPSAGAQGPFMGIMTPALMGLLGPAGFPFLNIGFASMSGGLMGAGIAALATGLGQATMALNRFTQEALKAAEAHGFVAEQYSEAQTDAEALKVVIGGLISVGKGEVLADLNKQLRMTAREQAEIALLFEMTKTKLYGEAISGPLGGLQSLRDLSRGNILRPFGRGFMFGLTRFTPWNIVRAIRGFAGISQRAEDIVEGAGGELDQTRMRSLRENFQPRFTDPIQYYRRIQLALLGGRSPEDKMIAAINELTDEIKRNNELEQGNRERVRVGSDGDRAREAAATFR